ncbi:hypothetical protein ACJMK2_006498 [Sinanodonta woodiana]|uniref:Hexosyltransferase n=1 Tax=Sinanodonta woodiana TaxID=1069815 RepID=A0ABD3VW49_SINWO
MADKSMTKYICRRKVLMVLVISVAIAIITMYATSYRLINLASIHSAIRRKMLDLFIETKPVLDNYFFETFITRTFNYNIGNDAVCKLYRDFQEIDLIIFIFTTHQRQKERDAIRKTWLNYSNKNTANIRYLFLLGEVPDRNLRKLVEIESAIHTDILKGDFVDTYQNLTYKTMMAFQLAITKCSHAKFLLKTDDDMWVNIPGLLKILQRENTTLQTAVGGACHRVAYPIRNPASKWYASFQSYPNESYPGYCSGTGYVTSINVARAVFEISKHVPFFHLEDVYVAICISKLGYNLHPIAGFNSVRPPLDPCVYKGDNLITSHEVSSEMLTSLWNTTCIT